MQRRDPASGRWIKGGSPFDTLSRRAQWRRPLQGSESFTELVDSSEDFESSASSVSEEPRPPGPSTSAETERLVYSDEDKPADSHEFY